ncbi:MAG TPA: two-component regulator propeller domain-containing protein [Saprospiraceae bacterium]|nr:two-component regulator propeller domain-containing protein [Saprospiraceae bacterium]HMQ84017.1 two-component regulator propeller domain-containing protein [Saprospiraceae bacterium]
MLLNNHFSANSVLTCLLWGMLVISPGLKAQDDTPFNSYNTEFFSVKDGLSERLINGIIQDKRGLLWLGTSNGLNLFDGKEFTIFNNHPNNPNQIDGSNIRSIYHLNDGKILIVYQNNLGRFDLFDPVTHNRETVKLVPETGISGIPRRYSIGYDGTIQVLTLSKEKLQLFKYAGGGRFENIFTIPENYDESSLVTAHFVQLRTGLFLINDTEKGLRLYTADGQLRKAYSDADLLRFDEGLEFPAKAHFLHCDSNGKVWLSLQGINKVYYLETEREEFVALPDLPQNGYYTHIWEDEKGNILLALTNDQGENPSANGLICVRPDGAHFDFSNILPASKIVVSVFARDFFGTIFLGIDTGLKVVSRRIQRIKKYLASEIGVEDRGAVMRGIASNDSGSVYFAREFAHWYELDLATGLLDTLLMIDETTGEEVDISCSLGLYYDANGFLWGVTCIDGKYGRLLRYDPKTCMTKSFAYRYKFNGFTYDPLDQVFWLVAEVSEQKGVLVRFDPKNGNFSEFNNSEGQSFLADARPRYILRAKSNQWIWVGTENGLYGIDPLSKASHVYRVDSEHPTNSISSNIIYVIHEDEDGQLWLGTTNGLNVLNPKNGAFEYYNHSNGLTYNTICGIVPDGKGNFWLSTYQGLSFFDRTQGIFRNFYREDGLSHDEFNRFSFYKDQDNRYYFGGVNGVNVFYPDDLLVDKDIPALVLTKITRYDTKKNKEILQISGLSQLKKLVIHSFDSQFSIHFTLPNFLRMHKNQYSTWLENHEKDWIYRFNSSEVVYNEIPPGKYTLHIKGGDANGNLVKNELILPIEVLPAFYETIAFYLLCFALTLLLIYSLFRYQLEQRLKVERIRTKLSSDIHDEVSGLLSGIAMQTDVMQFSIHDADSKEKLKQIGQVSRKAMTKMGDVLWSIDSRKDKMEELVFRMREHAEEILAPKDIAYNIKVDKIELNKKVPVTIRQDLYFMFKEAINNVAKHSNATQVAVQLLHDGPSFVMTIKDNGQPASTPKINGKTGQGLSNLQMRAQRIQAQLTLEQQADGFFIQIRRKRFIK